MKKIFPIALGLLFCLPMLSACAPSNAHKALYNQWTEFKTDANYSSFLTGNITYSTEIEAAKYIPSSPFYALTYHESLIGLSFKNIDNFANLFQIVPDYNQNQIKKLCGNVSGKINEFKAEVSVFTSQKARLESQVSQFGANSSAAKAELEDFMLDISILTIKANALQIAVSNALSTLYFLPIDRETPGDELQIEGSLSTIQSTLIDDYVTYSIIKQNGVHPNQTNQLYDGIVALNNAISNHSAHGTNYATWLNSYRLFEAENKMFRASLANVNLLADNSKLNGRSLNYYQKVQNFVNENANLFAQKTITLLF